MFFSLSYDSLLLSLLPPPLNTHNTSMASRSPRLLSLARRAFSSSSSSQANGVSLVQGASRGIGLEFVRMFLPQNQCFSFILAIHYIAKKFTFLHGVSFFPSVFLSLGSTDTDTNIVHNCCGHRHVPVLYSF